MTDSAISTPWTRRGAWADVLNENPVDAATEAGVTIAPRETLGIASVIATRRDAPTLAAFVAARHGVELPLTQRVASRSGERFVWAGPGQWLYLAEGAQGFAEAIGELARRAAVADQSGARAALRLSGPKVREALAKGCMIDTHPRAFAPGAVAITSIAHIGVHLWRVDDGANGETAFDLLVARSMAGSFWSWLSASAAEFGYRIEGGR